MRNKRNEHLNVWDVSNIHWLVVLDSPCFDLRVDFASSKLATCLEGAFVGRL